MSLFFRNPDALKGQKVLVGPDTYPYTDEELYDCRRGEKLTYSYGYGTCTVCESH
jgi:hypothetical protein